jgi:Flp pilus assembly protein TadG
VKLYWNDEGSAVVEFVVLAIPLLIPLIMYFGTIHENESLNSDLHNLARQGARAFISSPDESFEYARMQSVIKAFTSRVLAPQGISEIPTLTFECSATPCLTPDSRVKVTATILRVHQTLGGFLRFVPAPDSRFSASDVQIVDAWR